MIKLIFTILTILFCFHVNADVLVEPYLGYAIIGDGEYGNSATTIVENSYSSPTFGTRLGFQNLGFMIGLDFSHQVFELESKFNENNTTNSDVKKNQIGIFLGYDFPILLRMWGTYFFIGTLKGDKASRTYDNYTKLSKVRGFALGLGYKIMPLICLNAEYRSLEYDKWENSTGIVYRTRNQKLSEILLSVSFPFGI